MHWYEVTESLTLSFSHSLLVLYRNAPVVRIRLDVGACNAAATIAFACAVVVVPRRDQEELQLKTRAVLSTGSPLPTPAAACDRHIFA